MSITNKTLLTAVIGNPITHSMSPLIHNAIYKNEKTDAVMLAFGNPSIEKLVGAIRALPIHLTAVTMPHKQTLIPLLDSISDDAREIGAVNTVLNRDGKLFGFITDVTGIAEALKDVQVENKNVLIIGAGGVAQPIAYHLRNRRAKIFCNNRDNGQAEDLCKKFNGTVIDAKTMGSMPFDLIINATPIGMPPNTEASPVPKEIIRPETAVFDVVYSPLETKLMRDAREKGARVISGLTMFIAQALEQERIWLGRKIPDSGYTELIKNHLETCKKN
ncbi:MAG TPA: shikimate dehydrogenase [Candidatus Paceibacterota bacterium]|nr:shikimate dehydrogenase [Candidatus Paceibacterota bacterium]